jgi:hypothetical protein
MEMIAGQKIYQAPIGKLLSVKRVGDKVELESGYITGDCVPYNKHYNKPVSVYRLKVTVGAQAWDKAPFEVGQISGWGKSFWDMKWGEHQVEEAERFEMDAELASKKSG